MPSLKILAPGYDYLTLNRELIVQEFSDGVPNFAESPQNLKLGEDVRLAFPELVGMEIKSRFISMTSHEFRVPLTAVFSSTELLEQYSNNWAEEKKLKHFNRIKDSVNRMTALLDDVLIANKAESGKLEFNPQPLNLNQLCRDLVEDIQLGIGKQHEISWVNSGMASKACMDKKLLRHILTNLLTNAVKYSPPGSVVQFNCHCQEQEVIFEIKDQGIGIPLDDQKQLFESFHRAKNVGNIQGTGLGLSIVKKSVDLHRGTLAVHSEVGVGTMFKVTLPINTDYTD